MERFEEFLNGLKASYATFYADFSYKKVRDEVDKQNLDDTLRLNKTLADIQNQLLALPAALILAAAGLEAGKGVKNVAIVIGVSIFAVLMIALVSNQRSSVASIAEEVKLRCQTIDLQPSEVSSRFKTSFTAIDERVSKQRSTLKGLLYMVVVVWLCVCGLALYQFASSPVSTDAPLSTEVRR